MFGKEEKILRNCLGREQKPRKVVSSSSLKVPVTFYSPDAFLEVAALHGPPPLRGMKLENPTVGLKVMALRS